MAGSARAASSWLDRVRSDIDELGLSRRVADRLSWDARRFGITPRGIASRVVPGSGARLISISLPKAGTHLVERALCLHPRIHRRLAPTLYPHVLPSWGGLRSQLERQRPGELVIAHIPFEPGYLHAIERTGTKAFLVVRDPRDIVVSNAFYISGYRAHNWHRVLAAEHDLRGKLEVLIAGRAEPPRIPGIGAYLERYAGWLSAGCKVVRYEDLVGARDRRVEALADIYRHAGFERSDEEVGRIADELISPASPTFRRGGSGQWRQCFDDELARLFDAHAGHHLERYGYG